MRAATSISLILSAVAGLALADCETPTALVTAEASHGGAGNDLTNTTFTVPIGQLYANPDVLDVVSTLYLVGGGGGAPLDATTCTPYQADNGTGVGGLPFDADTPSFLSTNTVQVGSIVCFTS
ncbi:hypothetical protein F5Y15DRAFT_92075 [Xylariaceae sp. FL0016]|nr:hypothetical protein F5Y15DRAFT_92075 [Xylariaceae sp. FL0016]